MYYHGKVPEKKKKTEKTNAQQNSENSFSE